jgi:DNA-binding NarL/FixJ family response regulator
MHGCGHSRIVIADDHFLVAEAFKKLLSGEFDVVATVHDGQSLVIVAERLQPDVIVIDIGMPVLNGLEAGERIKRILPNVKLIYLTINHDPALVVHAMRRGASGYVLKTATASELVAAIHRALDGECYVSPLLAANSENPARSEEWGSPRTQLTDRQIEVLQLLAEGKSMKETAAILNVRTRTIAFHKYRIMKNLQVQNDAELVRYAVRNHVIFG